jgi:formylmethanofuran dehydrogenase subunit E-like metal-binding protein
VYLFQTYEKLDFDINKIKEMPELIKSLTILIKKDYADSDKKFADPYNINIINSKGKLTPIRYIDQIFEIVKEFPRREKVYFNIKPYFDVSLVDNKTKNQKPIESKEIVSEINVRTEDGAFDVESSVMSEQNFLDTLDELSKNRVKQVKELAGTDKTDKEIYELLNECNGDVDDALDKLWG